MKDKKLSQRLYYDKNFNIDLPKASKATKSSLNRLLAKDA
jgi:hypothetical protein